MAQKHTVLIVDDIDGSEGAQTVRFGFEDDSFEIDLTDANLLQFREALSPYLASARRLNARKVTRAGSPGKPKGDGDMATIRQWAAKNGYKVADRGRIPGKVLKAYQDAK